MMHLLDLDDAALTALAPLGVVRRARKDLEAGRARIAEHDEKVAKVEADGHTVRIDTRGPAAARCTCPAGGICRHVVMAVMAVNATQPPRSTPTKTAVAGLCELPEATLIRFAKADWRAATRLATSILAGPSRAKISENGAHCTVTLDGAPAPVIFMAGQKLSGAICKGPKTSIRILITAAAILVRACHGIALLQAPGEDASEEGLPQAFLEDAAQKLAQSVKTVLTGTAPLAAEILFDLAISARVEAAPRLTSELQHLSRQAQRAGSHDIHFEQEAFLMEAARTFALLQALKQQPKDPVLTGVPRRDYKPAAACDLWLLGGTVWSNDIGARGFTAHAFSPTDRRWYSVGSARAAGADPAFEPHSVYHLSLWGAGTPQSLMGFALHLPEPMVTDDASISLTLPKPAHKLRQVSLKDLIEAGVAQDHWAALRAGLNTRLGSGLCRRALPAPALLAPAQCSEVVFNELSQEHEWAAVDKAGDRIILTLPANDEERARRLADEVTQGTALLTEAAASADSLTFKPIALLKDTRDGLQVINLRLDEWPRAGGFFKGVKLPWKWRPALTAQRQDPLLERVQRTLEAAIEILAGAPPKDIATLVRSCEAAGLLTLAQAIQRMHPQDIPSVLAAVYLASEIQTAISRA